MAKNSPITHAHGWFVSDDNEAEWTVRDAAGVIVDISAWNFEWVLKDELSDPENRLSYQQSDTPLGFKTNGVDGMISLAVPDTDTDGFEGGQYVYALRRTNTDFEKTIAYGSVAMPLSAASVL